MGQRMPKGQNRARGRLASARWRGRLAATRGRSTQEGRRSTKPSRKLTSGDAADLRKCKESGGPWLRTPDAMAAGLLADGWVSESY
jgi:hypothetical protein